MKKHRILGGRSRNLEKSKNSLKKSDTDATDPRNGTGQNVGMHGTDPGHAWNGSYAMEYR